MIMHNGIMIIIVHINYLKYGREERFIHTKLLELMIGEVITVMILHGGVYKIYKINIMLHSLKIRVFQDYMDFSKLIHHFKIMNHNH